MPKEKGDRLWFKFILTVGPWLIHNLFKLVDKTTRRTILGLENQAFTRDHPSAFACFHQVVPYLAYYTSIYRGIAMVSRSFDGEIIHKCMVRFGQETARGSSSRGGKEALHEMIEKMQERKLYAGITVDAPRGPAGVVKMGIITLAKETGQPIVPITLWCTRKLQFSSWDNMVIPLPFGTMALRYGEPFFVPRGLDHEEYETLRQKLENRLTLLHDQAKIDLEELLMGKGK